MNREVRVIRPFDIGVSIAQVLDGTRLRFGSDECGPSGRITAKDPDDYGRRHAELIWTSESNFNAFQQLLTDGAAEAQIDPVALSLLVTANTSYLKASQAIFSHPLSDLENLPPRVKLSDPRPVALQTGFHGSTIAAYLLLAKDLEPRPLSPWRKGTWLARAIFRLSSDSPTSLFHPLPLDKAERDRLKLPSGVVHYLELGDHDPLRPYDHSDPPQFWVDKDLLTLLDARSRSQLSKYIQIELVKDFISAIIGSPDVQRADPDYFTWEDVEGSLLGRIVNFVVGSKATEEHRNTVLEYIRSDPAWIVSHVENTIGLRKELIQSLSED